MDVGIAEPGYAKLSPREIQCLHLIANGMTDVAAGVVMSVTRSAVRFHITNACRKMHARNRCEAIYRAAKNNLI